MNTKKIFILLFALIVYVNYVMHFKKDISKVEKQIATIENRITKEEKLFKEKAHYTEINSTKDYTYLFYDGKKLSYSEAMGMFQQDIQSSSKEANCSISNIQWQEMPLNKDRWYDVLSLRLSLTCTPQNFILFQRYSRKKSKFFIFNQIHLSKQRRKNLLRISMMVNAYRSKKDEN